MTAAEKILYKNWDKYCPQTTIDTVFVSDVILKSMEEFKVQKKEGEIEFFDLSNNPAKFVCPYRRLLELPQLKIGSMYPTPEQVAEKQKELGDNYKVYAGYGRFNIIRKPD